MKLRIGTRGSKLALAQSEWVRQSIEARYPDIRVELIRIKTKGDKILDTPLSKIGGKGLFVKEIEEALLKKEVDLAVHSMKDVPADQPDGLKFCVFPEREDPRDAFVSFQYETFESLPEGSTVGTSSLRRSAQILHMRSDLNIVPLRGNVDTRVRKLDSGDFQAVILAVAGLKRLGLTSKIRRILPADLILPAVGQGALGLEVREKDQQIRQVLQYLNHAPTEVTVRGERAFLKTLGGGCQVPIAGHCLLSGETLILRGLVAEVNGSRIIRDELKGSREHPEDLGFRLAKRLLEAGADRILERIYGQDG